MVYHQSGEIHKTNIRNPERGYYLVDSATKKANIAVTKQDLFFTLLNFTLLWGPKDQPVDGAMAKYAKRIEQLPAKAIEQWENLTGADSIHAAMSLTAEADLFLAIDYPMTLDRFQPAWLVVV